MDILKNFYAQEMLIFKCLVSRISGTISKTPISTISRLDPWRKCEFLMPFLQIVYSPKMLIYKFQVSNMSQSKTPLSTISRLNPWRTYGFLTHFLQIVSGLEMLILKFKVSRMFNFEPSLLNHLDLQYSLFHVSTHQL